MTRTISVQEAEGCVLAMPVTSPTGTILLPAGTELTARRISKLFALDVTSVAVSDAPPSARLVEVEQLFAGHEDDDLMMALKRCVLPPESTSAEGDGGGGARR